jgi:hypothetical protein
MNSPATESLLSAQESGTDISERNLKKHTNNATGTGRKLHNERRK